MEKKKKYILAIDQSTSATKVMLFNKMAELIRKISLPHKQYYPQKDFVEHDGMEIFNNTVKGMDELVADAGIQVTDIASVAITNQRETSIIWDKNTGEPVCPVAVWQCQRGVKFCNELRENGWSEKITSKTGLLIDPYFSASKLHWMMTNIDGLKEKANSGEILMGTMDSWLLWKLSGGKVHATDFSNACRTMLFNIHTLEWDNELLEICELKEQMLPEVKYSDEIFGYTDPVIVLGQSLPISGLIGDSHGALFGHHGFTPGIGKATYGTGSSVMMNIGMQPIKPPEGLVTSIGFGRDKKIDYVFEGNIHSTGDTINWLVNELQLISNASETEDIASSVEGTYGVYLVPAFVGLGAPFWDNNARAAITGMSRNSSKAHIVRAALESIAYQVKDLVDLMGSSGEVKLKHLSVDGGPTRNNFLMQFQADMIKGSVNRSNIEEISALGTAFLAGLAVGFWQDIQEIESLGKPDRTFIPQISDEKRDELYEGWNLAVARTRLKKKK